MAASYETYFCMKASAAMLRRAAEHVGPELDIYMRQANLLDYEADQIAADIGIDEVDRAVAVVAAEFGVPS